MTVDAAQLQHLFGKIRPQLARCIKQARPILLLVLAAVQDEVGFRAGCDRLLVAVSSHASPFTLAATRASA